MTETSTSQRMRAVDTIVRMRDLVEEDRKDEAVVLGRTTLPLAPATSIPFAVAVRGADANIPKAERVRGLTEPERTAICHRDGFIDRLSPERWRLVYPGAIRVLSLELPGAFETDVSKGTVRAYRTNAPVWWDLWPTVDHLQPRARGGTNSPENLACVSWWRNAAKGELSLAETGWELQPGGSHSAWDGLLGWFVERVAANPRLIDDPMVRRYLDAARGVEQVPLISRGPVQPTAVRPTAVSPSPSEPSADPVAPRPRPSRCKHDVWETNTRGAYHSHERQRDPWIWEAGNGLWRVVQMRSGRSSYRLERRSGDEWSLFATGDNSDRLLAEAAVADKRDGVPQAVAELVCWRNNA